MTTDINTRARDFAGLWNTIKGDYAPGDEMLDASPLRVALAKRAIAELPLPQRTVLLAYVDLQSYRATGALLGLSHDTIRANVLPLLKRVRDRIAELAAQMPKDIEMERRK